MSNTHSVQEDMLDFYRTVLLSVNVKPNEHGALDHYTTWGSEPRPLMVDGKRLMLPTRDNMRSGDKDMILFHPLSEATDRGESPVFHQLKDLVLTKIAVTLTLLMRTVLEQSMTSVEKVQLTSKQIEFLGKVSPEHDLQLKLIKNVEKALITGAQTKEPQNRLCTIYIKRDAKPYGSDEKYKRAAVVSFPLIREFLKEPEKVAGQTFAGYERKAIANVLRLLVPNADQDDYYSVFNNPTHAPTFSILMQAWQQLALQLNKSLDIFSNFLPESEQSINLDWFIGLNNIGRWIGIVPPQAGNEGVLREESGETSRSRNDNSSPDRGSDRVRDVDDRLARSGDSGQREEINDRSGSRDRETPPAKPLVGDGTDLLKVISSLNRDEERGGNRSRHSRDDRVDSRGRSRNPDLDRDRDDRDRDDRGRGRGRSRDDDYDRDYDRGRDRDRDRDGRDRDRDRDRDGRGRGYTDQDLLDQFDDREERRARLREANRRGGSRGRR